MLTQRRQAAKTQMMTDRNACPTGFFAPLRLCVTLALVCVWIGCAEKSGPQADPTPSTGAAIDGARASVERADGRLALKPPAVPEARSDLATALGQLGTAKSELAKVAKQFLDTDRMRLDAEGERDGLKKSFWSYRQKRLVFWFILACVVLGVLAAVGDNIGIGWWSLPALWAVKLCRFVIFAGIPHLIQVVKSAVAIVVEVFQKLFHKKPRSDEGKAAAAGPAV